ncbi:MULTISPECIES: MetQ/NlpA family ABC transporter substrate-binding protein [Rothia]|uniref:NLPA lipoprotein n=1 Tax=Rothia aeria F0474 TaxID=1125724 RepID=I0UWJ1_9MICC|nr:MULTISPECIES: MetQ/NlpA family ABC transporter substrate-binding protein [Rothia]MBF1654116.1 methionine-binding protein [Rothia dentocariosa]EID52244.1 NLPA lipoprotein [Rothia aeria F0474]MDK7677559.1 MetQ/NlpA family ABC transporter substrate-binding protein [Rothia aeria]MDO4884531.1 MetQ/NlpA family ABC transporter substrate-binding protein [Rothia sp. (in: high G+C Gram-positive bacteria)]QQT88373.1 methionine-binding protein [Rothia aeria]
MKKFVAALAVVPLVFSLAACGSSSNGNGDSKKITIGVVGNETANQVLKDEAAKQGITIEYSEFTDYAQPNPAVDAGDNDMNRFQHIAYLANYNVSSGKDLQIVGSTNIYPMAIFSKKHKKVDEIPQGGTIAIPNDSVNEARALLLLKAQNLVTFKSEVHTPTHNDIDTGKSKVKVTPVDAAQTVVSLDSVDAAVINNTFLADAGLNPSDALAQDDPNNPDARRYVNLFVAQKDKVNDETYKKVVEIFHSKTVQDAVKEDSKNTAVEVNLSQDELKKALENEEAALKK